MTRQMGEFNVYQQTKDAYFDASALLQQWNMNRKTQKKMSIFLDAKDTKAFMEELINEVKNSQVSDNQPSKNIYLPDNQEVTLIYTIKGKNTKSGKTPDKVWMHPYLFIKFAMWLNPRFEVQVIKFVYDQLITLRMQIGDEYKNFSAACARIGCKDPEDYKVMARCLNCAVLGLERQTNQRNEITAQEAAELHKVQNVFTEAVDNGWIGNIQQAKQFFKREYEKRQPKLPFNTID